MKLHDGVDRISEKLEKIHFGTRTIARLCLDINFKFPKKWSLSEISIKFKDASDKNFLMNNRLVCGPVDESDEQEEDGEGDGE